MLGPLSENLWEKCPSSFPSQRPVFLLNNWFVFISHRMTHEADCDFYFTLFGKLRIKLQLTSTKGIEHYSIFFHLISDFFLYCYFFPLLYIIKFLFFNDQIMFSLKVPYILFQPSKVKLYQGNNITEDILTILASFKYC